MNATSRGLWTLALAGTFGFAGCGGDTPTVMLPMPTVPQHSPEAAVKAVLDAAADGNPAGFWAALPKRYQDDVNFLVRDFALKMDPEVYDEAVALVGRLVAVFKDKRHFLQQSGMISKMVPAGGADAEAGWDCAVDIFGTITRSELGTVRGLLTFDGGDFLRGTGATVVRSFDQVVRQKGNDLAELRNAQVNFLREEHGHRVLRLSMPGETDQDVAFTQVDGKWLPAELVASWDQAMGELKKGVDEMPDLTADAQVRMQSQMVLGMVRGIVEQLEAAGSAQEFEQALMGVGGMMMGGAGPR